MATHSSVLAWRIPGTGEPGGLLSMGSHRVGYDWSNSAAAAAARCFLTSYFCIPVPYNEKDICGTTDCFQIGKGICQGYILSLCLFNFYAEYIMLNARLDEAQDGIKIAGRNISNLRYTDNTILIAKSKEELRDSWWRWKRTAKKLASLDFLWCLEKGLSDNRFLFLTIFEEWTKWLSTIWRSCLWRMMQRLF